MAKYDAFISYSHSDDVNVAVAFERGLRRIGRAFYQRSVLNVFRDASTLPASEDLPEAIRGAMRDSANVVLLASTNSAGSKWVRQELEWWFELRERASEEPRRLFIVLLTGEIVWDDAKRALDDVRTTAIVPALHARFTTEPGYMDVRDAVARRALSYKRRGGQFRAAVVAVAAPILGVPMQRLDDEDARKRRRAYQLAGAAATAVAVSTSVGYVGHRQSVADRLTNDAIGLVEKDPARGVWLAEAALNEWRSDRAEQAFRATLEQSRLQVRLPVGVDGASPTKVRRVRFDREGRRVMTLGERTVQLWNATTGAPDSAAIVPSTGVTTAAIAVDGDVLTANAANVTQLWSPDGPRWTAAMFPTDLGVRDARFGGDDRLVTTVDGGDVQSWRRRPDGWVIEHVLSHHVQNAPVAVDATAFDAAGTRLATAAGRRVRIWDLRTGHEIAELPKHEWLVTAVDFDSDDPDLLLTAMEKEPPPEGRERRENGNPSGLRVWDLRTNAVVARFLHPDSVFDAAFSPHGDLIVSAGGDGNVRVWDVATSTELFALAGHSAPVKDVEFDRLGERVVTASDDGTARVWTLRSVSRMTPLPYDSRVYATAVSDDGARLAVGTGNQQVELWDVQLRRRLRESPEDGAILTTTFLDGRSLLVATQTGTVCVEPEDVQEPCSARETSDVIRFEGPLVSVDVDRGHGRLLTANGTAFQAWNLSDRTPVGPSASPGGDVRGAAFVDDGSAVAVIHDRSFELWDPVSAARTWAGDPEADPVTSIAVSCDRRSAVTASGAGVRMWTTSSRAGSERLSTRDPVTALAISCGETVAAASGDTVRLWNLRDPKPLRDLGHRSKVSTLAFSGDSRLLATGEQNGTVSVWDLRDGGRPVRVVDGQAGTAAVERIAFGGAGDAMLVVVTSDQKTGTVSVFSRDRFAPLQELRDEARQLPTIPSAADGGVRMVDAGRAP